ncbi:hypothetical protein IV38_GL000073 [Lactobacillus selangorensis]|uniref:RNA 2-O ribose methyltransferase substrate binding domain-containing protein n=1 Tax=Lactobacillus selangorensis TaxID=81857 RepID=A0A0R2FSK5_9LACO|nr:23S rRNA (guanosine(2251)-2'-O)-methyltransferase RlmB [Lactobacillus selangorensis]KRN29193.1 hypothetical protein IV38_GL000073 [Lactobacillus selangorensis]KRN31449.1 hypothetical protein IV40_GL001445 [Lactobacillus selangorensis]
MKNNNRRERRDTKPRAPENEEEQQDFVIGRHSALETLRQEDNTKINKVFVQEGIKADAIAAVKKLAKEKKIIVQEVPKRKLDKLSDNGNHQGIVVAIAPYSYVSVADILQRAKDQNEDPFVLILDNVEDPHNLGSIMRTADAVGVHGIIIPKHRSASLTSTVAKTSTGAIEHVPVARVTNLAQTIKKLKKEGFWIFGTMMNGTDYRKWNATGSIGLVIGNEGKGISTGLQKEMDENLTIPMVGHVQSLNASVAASILMYQAFAVRHPLS